jgi:hypothetical protein
MTLRQLGRGVLLACTLLGVAPGMVMAQSAITGTVRDVSGAVLPGVIVEASSPALIERVRSATTDGSGVYRIVDLRPGLYKVTFGLEGFTMVIRDGVDLPAAFTATLNAELKIGSVEESITVTGQSPLVDVSNVVQQTVMKQETIDAVPAARIATALTSLLPGVVTLGLGDPVGRQQLSLTIHGSRAGEQTTTIDGFSNRMALGVGGTSSTFYNNQAMAQEISVNTGGGSAEQQFAGVWTNIIPKEGGNRYSGQFFTAYANENLSTSNLNDELRSRGITNVAGLKKIWDLNPAIGGPIVADKLWFFGSYRYSGVSQYRAGFHYNSTPLGFAYTPDLTRPAYVSVLDDDYSARLTWQATTRNKINLYYDRQPHVVTHRNFDSLTSPEATNYTPYIPNYFAQGVWKSPVTSRLLLEAGMGGTSSDYNARPQTGQDPDVIITPGTMSAVESTTGIRFRAPQPGAVDQAPGSRANNQANIRASATYVTGSHAFKAGLTYLFGSTVNTFNSYSGDIQVSLLNGVPRTLTLAAIPAVTGGVINRDIGVFVQDQWTLNRMTLNYGVRYDNLNNSTDPVDLPAGRFVPARSFAGVRNAPNWHDISPRFGASWDLFGTGETAIKFSLNRYVAGQGTGGLTTNLHPVTTSVLAVNRTWTDINRDYIPDCDLRDPLVNGECGQISDLNFGQNNPNATRYDPAYTDGFGVRGYNWESSVLLQHQLTSGISASAGYFHRTYGNFTVTDNLQVTPSDFDEYCITVPVDPNLPGGGGNQLCGLYDVVPAKFGRVQNLVSLATDDYGKQTETYDGVDVTVNARLPRGANVSGGVNVGRTATNACNPVDSPQGRLFCDVTFPFQPNIKFMGTYPLPWYGLQVSATIQNVPGAPITANYTARNSEIAPSLGRPLSAGVNGTATVPLLQPGTLFEDRQTQFDLRFTKRFAVGGTRILGNVDLFNLLNLAGIDAINPTYGPSWLQPTRIQGTRYVKFSAQIDF